MFAPNRIRELVRLLRINASAFLTFQLLIVLAALGIDILRSVAFSIMKTQLGVTALVQGNFMQVFQNPVALAVFLLLLLFELFVLLMGFIGIVRIYAAGVRGERIRARTLLKECARFYFGLFKPSRILIVPILVLTSLLSFVSVIPSSLGSMRLPEFIADWFQQKEFLKYSFYALRLLMTGVWAWMLFAIVGIFFEGKTLRRALADTTRALRARKRKYVLFLLGTMAAVGLLQTALYYVWIGLTYLWQSGNEEALETALRAANQRAETYIPIFGDIVQIGFFVVTYGSLFGIPLQPMQTKAVQKRWWRRLVPILLIFLVLELWYNDMPSFLMESEERPIIIAHRAGGLFAPENSLEALQVTKESKIAKAVEIDVQMTNDGVLVLHHDNTLRRITNDKRKVSDIAFAELQKLPTRSTDGFMIAPPIPTLDAFLDAAGELYAMIEVKETGPRAEEVLRKTIDLVREKGFTEKAMIASMDRNILKLSKEIEPKLPTVFITAILIGEDFSDSAIDWFSIEASGLSIDLVLEAHSRDKKVVVWTINTLSGVKRALRSRPDGIVTDNVFYTDYSIDALEDKIWFQSDIMMHFVSRYTTQTP